MAPDQTPATDDYGPLTCILPDCRAVLAVRWELYAPLVHGELEPGGVMLTPGDALGGGWRVECHQGHVILLPEVAYCDAEDPECMAGDCHHGEELAEWRRADIERLAALLRSAGVLPGEDAGHVIEFRETGWTLKHPLACRPNLFDCPINRLAEVELREPPAVFGRFEVSANDLGDRLLIGDRIDPPDRQ